MTSRLDDRIRTMMQRVVDQSPPPPDLPTGPRTVPVTPQRVPNWAAAVGAAMAVFVLIGGVLWLIGGTGTEVIEEPIVTTTVGTTQPPTTTTTVSSTAPPVASTTTMGPVADQTRVAATTSLGVFELVSGADGAVRVDTGDMAYSGPGVFQFPDGRWRIVYMVGGVNYMTGSVSETSIRMATCVDADCGSVEIVELLATAPYSVLVGEHSQFEGNWVSFDADGTPYLLWHGSNEGASDTAEYDQTFELVTCASPACGEVVAVEIPHWWVPPGEPEDYYYATALAASPSGEVALTYFHAAPEDSSVRIAYCDQTLSCGSLDEGFVVFEIPGEIDDAGEYFWDWVPNHLSVGFGPTGLPVLTYSWAFDGAGQWVVSCSDRECTTATDPVLVAEHPQTGWPAQVLAFEQDRGSDGLLIVYESMGESGEIGVSTCGDMGLGPVCLDDEVGIFVVAEIPDWGFAPFSAAMGTDGLARIVWTTASGFEHAQCHLAVCSEVTVTNTGIPAKTLTLTITDEGQSVIGLVDETGIQVVRLP